MRAFACSVASLILLGAAPLLDAGGAADLIESYDLEVADTPVRERPGWRKPERILVAYQGSESLAWLQEAVQDVELVGVGGEREALEAIEGADGVVGLCTSKLLAAGEALRWIQLYSAGVEHCVGLPEFSERKPLLTNMQRIAGPVIAEHVMAMVLALSRNLDGFIGFKDSGQWRRDATGDMQVIRGKTMLVAGLGGIGTETARRAHALGMTVTATRASSREGPDFVSRVGLPGELPELAAEADVIVNALPLTDETRGLFDAELFGTMKSSALFINVGRGGTVVTDDLVAALNSEAIAGAGLDVTDPEPLPENHPLWRTPNTIITPHVAGRADIDNEARRRLVRENLRRYANGEPMISVVDPERGY